MVPCWRGPATQGGRQACWLERWIHRSTALGICEVQASSVMGTSSLWNFTWGMGEGNGGCQHLCSPTELCPSGVQQLSLPASSRPPYSLRAELLTFHIPDVKSRWLSELMESGPPDFASQTLGALPCMMGCPSTTCIPPTSPCSMHRLSAFPTLFSGPLV